MVYVIPIVGPVYVSPIMKLAIQVCAIRGKIHAVKLHVMKMDSANALLRWLMEIILEVIYVNVRTHSGR
jgi:hypothetical protein